jgi:hypothetical protein
MVFALRNTPFIAFKASALNSPVLGRYSRLAFDVLTVESVPVVTVPNSG